MKLNDFWSKAARQVAEQSAAASPEAVVAATPEATPEAAPSVDLSFIPQDFHVDGKPDTAKFAEHYQQLSEKAGKASEEPVVPDAYEFSLPADLKFDGMPEGFAVEIDTTAEEFAPLFTQLGDTLKAMKAPAELAPQMMGLLAQYKAAEISNQIKAGQRELATLGEPTQVSARIETVTRSLQSALPAEEATALMGAIKTASGIKALEKLLSPKGMATPTPTPAPKDPDADLRDYYSKPTR